MAPYADMSHVPIREPPRAYPVRQLDSLGAQLKNGTRIVSPHPKPECNSSDLSRLKYPARHGFGLVATDFRGMEDRGVNNVSVVRVVVL